MALNITEDNLNPGDIVVVPSRNAAYLIVKSGDDKHVVSLTRGDENFTVCSSSHIRAWITEFDRDGTEVYSIANLYSIITNNK